MNNSKVNPLRVTVTWMDKKLDAASTLSSSAYCTHCLEDNTLLSPLEINPTSLGQITF